MTILITGATGSIGRHVVDGLLAAGIPVRALSRTPATAALPDGVPVVEGDVATAPDAAFDGVDAVYLFPAEMGADSFVERAIAAGVGRFVVLSSLAVSGRHARDADSVSGRHHAAVESAVTTMTDAWTMVRPGNLANNLLSWAFAIRAGYPVRIPYPTSSQVLLHEVDVARAAVGALMDPGQVGQIVELTGPTSLTKVEQLGAIGAALGRDLPWIEVTPEEFRSDVVQYIGDELVDLLLRYWSESIETPEVPLPAPAGLTMTPLRVWAEDHRAAFGG